MDNNSSYIGIGFFGLLAIVFITLKILGEINWSWLWVLSPLWLPALCALPLIVIILIVVWKRK